MRGDFPMQPWLRTRRHLGPALRGTGPIIISVKPTVCCVYLNSREWITPGIRTQLRAIGPIGLSPALTAPVKLSTPNHKIIQINRKVKLDLCHWLVKGLFVHCKENGHVVYSRKLLFVWCSCQLSITYKNKPKRKINQWWSILQILAKRIITGLSHKLKRFFHYQSLGLEQVHKCVGVKPVKKFPRLLLIIGSPTLIPTHKIKSRRISILCLKITK